jgi:hypothetical protein
VLLGVWHFGRLPGDGPLLGPLQSAAHFPVFGLLAALIFVALRRFAWPSWQSGWRAYARTLVAMLVLSAVAEWSQHFTDRNASLGDVAVNVAGAVAVLCLLAVGDRQIAGVAQGRTRRLTLMLVPVVLAMLALLPVAATWATIIKRDADFPCLVCPESRLDVWRLEANGASAQLVRAEGGRGTSLEIRLERGAFPGVSWEWPAPDWRGFDALVLELGNPGPEALALTLRIDDAQHDFRFTDRFNRPITLASGARHRECIPLSDIASAPEDREMDLSAVARLMLFAGAESQGQRFQIHRIRLISEPEGC